MGMAAKVQGWWSDYRVARAYEALQREEREALARDAGIPQETLARLVSRGAAAGTELPRLLEALHLDPETLRRKHPDVMRDLQITCSTCAATKECRRDLGQGIARLTFHQYCPNADTLAALESRPHGGTAARA